MKVLWVAANSAKKALLRKENGWVRKFNIRSESWLAWLKKKKKILIQENCGICRILTASICCKIY